MKKIAMAICLFLACFFLNARTASAQNPGVYKRLPGDANTAFQQGQVVSAPSASAKQAAINGLTANNFSAAFASAIDWRLYRGIFYGLVSVPGPGVYNYYEIIVDANGTVYVSAFVSLS